MNKATLIDQLRIEEHKEHIYKAMAFILLSAFIVVVLGEAVRLANEHAGGIRFFNAANPAPHYSRIMNAIKDLRYSGLETFTRPDVALKLDFARGVYILTNFFKFDAAGNFVLEGGRYGTCGELAAETHKRIQPILADRYKIEFVKSGELSYFFPAAAAHVVIRIIEKRPDGKAGAQYILDPSYKRYGPAGEFEDYSFLEAMPKLDFVQNRLTYRAAMAGALMPLLIKNGHLLGFVVREVNERFDKDNYLAGLVLVKKHSFVIKDLFTIRNSDGRKQTLEDRDIGKGIITHKEYLALKDKVTALFEGIEKEKKGLIRIDKEREGKKGEDEGLASGASNSASGADLERGE